MKVSASLLIAILLLTWGFAAGDPCGYGCSGDRPQAPGRISERSGPGSSSGALQVLAHSSCQDAWRAAAASGGPEVLVRSYAQGIGQSPVHCNSCPCLCHHLATLPANIPLPLSEVSAILTEPTSALISLFPLEFERPPRLS